MGNGEKIPMTKLKKQFVYNLRKFTEIEKELNKEINRNSDKMANSELARSNEKIKTLLWVLKR